MDTLKDGPPDPDTLALMEHLATGRPLDPAVAARLREQGDRLRQALHARHGAVDIAVPAVRELRGELPGP